MTVLPPYRLLGMLALGRALAMLRLPRCRRNIPSSTRGRRRRHIRIIGLIVLARVIAHAYVLSNNFNDCRKIFVSFSWFAQLFIICPRDPC